MNPNQVTIDTLAKAIAKAIDDQLDRAKKKVVLDFEHGIRVALLTADDIDPKVGDWMIDALRDTLAKITDERRAGR